MVAFRSFRGLRYDPRVVNHLSGVLCPPYDLITNNTRNHFYELSPYNAVRLEAGESFDTDTPKNNRNTRTAEIFQTWIAEDALVKEDKPALYLIKQSFTFRGNSRSLIGLIGMMKLEEYEKRVILPHEHTSEEVKQDRLALMEACAANFSPIMCLYQDEHSILENMYRDVMTSPPSVTIGDSESWLYDIWVIKGKSLIDQLTGQLKSKSVYIADGHHRYETALMYRNRLRSHNLESWNETAQANFIMTELCNIKDSGLMVLPYHRVVSGLEKSAIKKIQSRLQQMFNIEFVAENRQADLNHLLHTIENKPIDECVLGFIGSEDARPCILTLREEYKPSNKSPVLSIDSLILEDLILRPVLGETLLQHVSGVSDIRQVGESLRTGVRNMAFIVKPLSLELFQHIVDLGKRLPPKSTYFYPKLPTGLTLRNL